MPASLRSLIKPAVEAILASAPARRIGARHRRGQRLILAYHNVILAGRPARGDQSLHLDFDRFRRHLDVLEQTGAVVPLRETLAWTRKEPCYAITFDDAYSGAVRLALPELSSRSIPATVFVAPGLLGHLAAWWDAVASDSSGLSEKTRAMLLDQLGGEEERVIAWARQQGLGLRSDDSFHIAGEAELLRAAALPGITLGSHSWGHPNLTRLSDAGLKHELEAPLQWLRERAPDRAQHWLAYPYGLHDARVRSAAESAGYTLGLAIQGGWHGSSGSSLEFPRLNVPAGLSAPGLKTRLNGFLAG